MAFYKNINDTNIKQKLKDELFSDGKTNWLNVKKIPPELRRPKNNYKSESNIFKRFVWRLKEDSQYFRSVVQITFALLIIWIGVEFSLFVKWGESGGQSAFYGRPPGVEGFLPISALMSLKYWLQTGVINEIRPSGLFILLAIITLGFLLRKSFCSWLCPIGTISESLWLLGKKIFKNNLTIPKFFDYPLRSLKYILLGLFVYAVFGMMDVPSLKAFIYSPYNKVADIKMYYFFANISTFTIWTLVVLVLLSVAVKNFWCRFLCPYGALLGILGWLSPIKIKRNRETCIDCDLCTKACPSLIKVHKVNTVWSDECTSCLECVQACPVKNTLELKTHFTNTRVANWVFAALIIGVFVGVTGLAMLSGNWQNNISKEEYLKRFKELDTPLYQHNQGQVPDYGPND
jgi:polyferredoxin